MAINAKERLEVWTYEEYLRLNDGRRYEVINGRLVQMPAPGFEHQKTSIKLASLLLQFAEEKGKGQVLASRYYVDRVIGS